MCFQGRPVVSEVAVSTMGLLFMALLLPFGYGQSLDLSPAPSSDGTAIDQGIAYILLLLALAVTYLIH
ncbi:hypothetical protein V6N13_002548 [Hibiscus sabdariffa]|uniref:Uncharacterized protein n=2 Tax=Hibiscus sabdariffa TaxID=183260 RepID=A0ABR2C544_9ROSI